MMNFVCNQSHVEFHYEVEYGSDGSWVWDELQNKNEVTIAKIFCFRRNDLLNQPSNNADLEGYTYIFRFGTLRNDYIKIPANILSIKNDVWITTELVQPRMKLKRRHFTAERGISVFGRLSKILNHSNAILVGGLHDGAIPLNIFEELLRNFPNSYEIDRYAEARVHTILSQYLGGMKDARGIYEKYLNKKNNIKQAEKLDLNELKKLEIEKYILLREIVQNALDTKSNLSEHEWQNLMADFLLLLFPRYIKVLKNVKIADYYTGLNDKKVDRFIDIALIDSNGYLDVIEVKKPFEDKIFRNSLYRDNNIPTSELAGCIMQAEKYLFHLSKWGVDGETTLSEKYCNELPSGMKIRISNPKAIIVLGRDEVKGSKMTSAQLLDFEIIKRKYANMLDIITYDDLLRRLDNTISSLKSDCQPVASH